MKMRNATKKMAQSNFYRGLQSCQHPKNTKAWQMKGHNRGDSSRSKAKPLKSKRFLLDSNYSLKDGAGSPGDKPTKSPRSLRQIIKKVTKQAPVSSRILRDQYPMHSKYSPKSKQPSLSSRRKH